MTNNSISWKDAPLWTVENESGPDQQTPNSVALVQEIIDMDGWNENNAMTFVMNGTGNRTADAFESGAAIAPHLYVTFIKDPSQMKLSVPIKTADDDMEAAADGSLDDGSSDLEIVDESTNQVIGLRFQDITIPKGATIVDAYVQFTVDEANKSKYTKIRPYNWKVK